MQYRKNDNSSELITAHDVQNTSFFKVIQVFSLTIGFTVLMVLFSLDSGGYHSSNHLISDATVQISMQYALTDLRKIHRALLRIYPLRADNYFVHESSGEMVAIQVVDLGGRLLLLKGWKAGTISVF